jgi:hypothetical protein
MQNYELERDGQEIELTGSRKMKKNQYFTATSSRIKLMTDGQAIFLPVTTSNTTKIQIRHPFAAK